MMAERKMHILIVEARFYDDISDELLQGATAALDAAGASFDRVEVPGALEIPGVIALAAEADADYDGFVALGCVIRGETGHYDIVAGESARALMDLTVQDGLAIGNGILTVDNHDQAMARARREERDKGGFAARACLTMIGLQRRFLAQHRD